MEDVGPTEEELEKLIEPLWKETVCSIDAQHIRAQLSVAVDSPKYKQWALDYTPDYVWRLIDIAVQRGINLGKKQAEINEFKVNKEYCWRAIEKKDRRIKCL